VTFTYSDEEGEFLVKLARNTVDRYVSKKEKPEVPKDTPKSLHEKSGVFVTLNTINGERATLRGCIGRPYPTDPLVAATIDSAVDSAVNDPRFPPVSEKELSSILIDLSVLTPPQKIEYASPEELLEKVKVGRDGLIAVRGMWRGLLLPQVPVDWGWDTEQFLRHTCEKASLRGNLWKDPETEFMAFQAEIFGEVEPYGRIIRNPKHTKG
jgi:hypothetical protein